MTGPEHYREAEQLLHAADIAIGQYEEGGADFRREIADNLASQAQAHATLALAAATTGLEMEKPWQRLLAGGDPS